MQELFVNARIFKMLERGTKYLEISARRVIYISICSKKNTHRKFSNENKY